MSRSTNKRLDSDHRGAFTLIELLVAIGIVAVLTGLLLPALHSARTASKQVACLANLRQWAEALHIYANQSYGFIPRRGQGVQATNQITRPQDWFNALPPLLGMPAFVDMVTAGTLPRPDGPASSVWICPEAIDLGSKYYWSYGMNMGLSVEIATENGGQPAKMTGVGDTTAMVFMADGPGNYCSVFPSGAPDGYNPVARHNRRVNVSFVDGHAASFPADYLAIGKGLIEHDDMRWHPPNSTWNTGQ